MNCELKNTACSLSLCWASVRKCHFVWSRDTNSLSGGDASYQKSAVVVLGCDWLQVSMDRVRGDDVNNYCEQL